MEHDIDVLGDLVAHDLFEAHVAHDLERASRRGAAVGVVLISPRGEDGSPNGLSPATRREMLRRVAARVRDRVDQRDTVAVLRHDLFGVILSAVPGPREASEVAGRLARAVSAPFSVPGAEVAMTCLVGVATSADGEGPIDARSLVGRAVASLRHTGTARAANGLWPEAASVGLPPAGEPFSATA